MEKVKDDRSARVHSEHESVLASQGDLDAAGEAELKRAAGASSLVRAMHSVAVSKSFSSRGEVPRRLPTNRRPHRRARHAGGLEADLLTSKQEMADQLQKRSETGDARLAELKTKRDALERERSNAQYGYASDPQATEKITQAQRALNEADEAAAERARAAAACGRHAQASSRRVAQPLDLPRRDETAAGVADAAAAARGGRRATTTRRSTLPMPSSWASSTAWLAARQAARDAGGGAAAGGGGGGRGRRRRRGRVAVAAAVAAAVAPPPLPRDHAERRAAAARLEPLASPPSRPLPTR